MSFELRPYQKNSLDALYRWWTKHMEIDATPLLVMPTGAGKSVVIAELVRLLFDTWPEEHPRTLVIVPSKELAEQNADKLARMLPSHITLGYYSASLGRRQPSADVIVATIGSVADNARILGNIKCVIIDEAHLVNPDGAGRYRQLLADLAKYCRFRVVGLTATPFRGNGVWLTDGKDPLFCGIAHEVKIGELLDAGHLAPLIRPMDTLKTRVDTSGISIASTGDYNMDELSARVSEHLSNAANEAVSLAADRQKWLAFTPTVQNARELSGLFTGLGVSNAVVCGDTPKKERESHIARFRAGQTRCLVTVLALATGFDVPDVDCLIWLRPTISPVLYVQGCGRGLRPSLSKNNCLWLDFTDTTERLGPVDGIRGRKRSTGKEDIQAPYIICDACGAQVRPASAKQCPYCGAALRDDEEDPARAASNAPIMSHQIDPIVVSYPIDRVAYREHRKEGSRTSMRVDYFSGLNLVVKEWVCLGHDGFARAKAERWWGQRMNGPAPYSVQQAIELCYKNARVPSVIRVNESGKFPEIVGVLFDESSTA